MIGKPKKPVPKKKANKKQSSGPVVAIAQKVLDMQYGDLDYSTPLELNGFIDEAKSLAGSVLAQAKTND